MTGHKKNRFLRTIDIVLIVSLFVAAIPGGIVYGFLTEAVAARESLSLLTSYRPSTPTRLYDRNGNVFAELFTHRQELVAYHKIPPHVVQAFLAVEDDNFFNHIGIDFMGIFRAAITNLRHMGIRQGGSTLTQQLAKQIYLNAEGVRDRNFKQKIRETVLALQMEEELSKEEILEVYFNVIYLGHGCKGISCAARVYFDKNVEDLTLAEGAVLARLPKSPVDYSPFKNPAQAKEQHKVVLSLMADNGFIKRDDIEAIHDHFWEDYWGRVIVTPPSRNIYAKRLDKAPFFTDYVRQTLEKIPGVGEEELYTGGLRVYTTLDIGFQKIAEEELAVKQELANRVGKRYAKQGKRFGVDTSLFDLHRTLASILPVGRVEIKSMSLRQVMRKDLEESGMLDAAELLSGVVPAENEASAFVELRKDTVAFITNMEVQNALVTIEPGTGYINAMVGGTEFSPQNQFNRAVLARRQPGSAFKIFVYGAALEQRKIGSMSGLNDAPLFTITDDGSSWSPGNYDAGFRGMTPAKTALALSLNTCSVQAYFQTGPDPIIDFATRMMKISDTDRFSPNPSLALGSGEVTPLELATAAAIIGNDGKDVIPFAIRYVTDSSGNILYNQELEVRRILAEKAKNGTIQVIEPGLAFILRDMMEAVANYGTVTRGLRDQARFTGDMAAKTGTTSSWSDAWVVGFNPEYATVLWYGFDKSSITMGPGMAGGNIAAPVIGHYYKRIYDEAMKKEPPAFPSLSEMGGTPPGVVNGPCGGFALRTHISENQIIHRPSRSVCATNSGRMYDQSEMIMREMGISESDLK